MDLSAIFLGTGGSVPSARRSTASVLLVRGGRRMMFDCGEGTQRQLQRSLGLSQVDEIYLTHFHADHILGLPGLLKTYDLTAREEPLTIYGPRGLRDLFKTLGKLIGRTGYDIDLVEIEPGEGVRDDGAEVQAFAVEHSVRANGYALVEDERPGRFDPEAAKRLGVAEGPAFAALQRGEEVDGADGRVRPGDVMGEARAGRIVAITGDTAPCHSTVSAAADADLLVHDASFAEEEVQRAAETGHSTVGQAAAVAREAHVKMLALVHISSRYHVGTVLEEARDVFEPTVAPRDFDTIEIPFPERGDPKLVSNGARSRDETEGASTVPPQGTAE
jgi:ribonuclease Z